MIRLKTNPVADKLGASYVRQRTIAEIKTLEWINGSDIKAFERKDCEIYYMKSAFKEYFELANVPHYDYDFEEFTKYCVGRHPRLPELIKIYGNPYEVSDET